MSAEKHNKVTPEQLQELVKVGVGGKYQNNDNYLKLIQQELDHEMFMVRGGQETFNKTITNSKEKRQESTTLYGLVLQQNYISQVSELIHNDIKLMTSGKAGNHHISLKLACQCLPVSLFENGVLMNDSIDIWDIVSLIVLKNVIDGISDEITLNKLAIKIGTALMQEARITRFKEHNKKAFESVQRRLQEKNIPQGTSRYRYKSKVWTYMMKKNDLDFDSWSNVEKLHIGVKMISYLEQLGLSRHQNRKTSKNKTVTYVEATPKIIEEIKNFNLKNECLHPRYMPMIMPPRDWTSPFTGGFYGKKFNKQNNPEEIKNALQLYKANK